MNFLFVFSVLNSQSKMNFLDAVRRLAVTLPLGNRHTPSAGISYWVSFYLPLMGLFSGPVSFLTVVCRWKGKVFKEKLSSPWFFDYGCILTLINLGKRVEHLVLILLKISDSVNFQLKTTIIESAKIRRMKICNRLFGVLMLNFLLTAPSMFWRISIVSVRIDDLDQENLMMRTNSA